MIRLLCTAAVATTLVFALPAYAGEEGAIKRFVDKFPIPTYNLEGQGGDVYLEAATTPAPSDIIVDGWWPESKKLLISFRGNHDNAYLIEFSAVEMNNQSLWNQRLSVGKDLVCANLAAGRAPGKTVAGTNGFANPC